MTGAYLVRKTPDRKLYSIFTARIDTFVWVNLELKYSKWWANFQERDDRWEGNTCFRTNLHWSSMRQWSVFIDLNWLMKIIDENSSKNIKILANS